MILGAAALVAAVVIMVRGDGLQDSLDFGAGAYYYADIPEFDRYTETPAYATSVPVWLHAVLFLAWGALMYLIWKRIDNKQNN